MIKKIIGFLTLLISLSTLAQKNNVSPYSFFGVGDNTNNKTVEEIAMGQVGGAFKSTFQLSFTNPASYASLRFTTFALAVQHNALDIDDGTNSENGSSSSFSYLALGFPIGENSGATFGLQPNTTVGYSLLEEFSDANGEVTAIDLFTGEGGTNRVFVGFGHKIGKKFSVGIEAAYIFGSIENNLLNRREGVPLATMQRSDSDVSGAKIKAGVQYYTKVSEKITLSTGLVVDLANELKNEGNEYRFSLVNTGQGIVSPRDTILNKPFENTYKNPMKTTISAGIGEENKWYAGLEYAFQGALTIEDGLPANDRTYSYGNFNRISFGGYYKPKFNSITNYWQRVTYRGGLAYKKTGLLVNNTEINDFGISFGVGLPMSKQLSNINLGFELGTRGEVTNGLVKENYFNFRLGLSLSDKWFRKRKLD
jgi:hypothetical protein